MSTTTTVRFLQEPLPRPVSRQPGREAITYAQSAIVEQLARGLNTRQTAERLGISVLTVRAQIHYTHRRLGFTHRGELLVWALAHGFGSGSPARGAQ